MCCAGSVHPTTAVIRSPTETPDTTTLSLHDALPICLGVAVRAGALPAERLGAHRGGSGAGRRDSAGDAALAQAPARAVATWSSHSAYRSFLPRTTSR